MKLRDLLRVKGDLVYRASPKTTLGDAISTLVANNCGSLVVCDDSDPTCVIGIITERDILRTTAKRVSLDSTLVEHVMTRDIVTGEPDQSMEQVMGLMTQRRIRHLPIIEGGRLIGIISIGDIVKWQIDAMASENQYLKDYIQR